MRFVLILLSFSALCAEPEGKVFVQSIPPGATILSKDSDDKWIETGVKTPGLVTLPQGTVTLTLRKEGFDDAFLSVVVGPAIQKPEAVKLEVPRVEVEVTSSDPGWLVFVDNRPVKDKLGKRAMTPCTLRLPVGKCTLGWAKLGFVDTSEKVSIDAGITSIDMKAKPRPGNSALLALRPELVVGVYDGVHPNWRAQHRVQLNTDGSMLAKDVRNVDNGTPGKWVVRGNELVMQWFKYPAEPLTYDPVTGCFADKKGFCLTPQR